jgi:hypothetical protein
MHERLSSREKAGLDDFYSAQLGRCGRTVAHRFLTQVDRSSGGDDSEGETPGPIPNPAVKPFYADGSWSASSCESRSLPTELLLKKYYSGT